MQLFLYGSVLETFFAGPPGPPGPQGPTGRFYKHKTVYLSPTKKSSSDEKYDGFKRKCNKKYLVSIAGVFFEMT